MTSMPVRDFRESDRNFVLASWLKGLYFGNAYFREIPGDIFFPVYQEAIKRLLKRPQVKVDVVCLSDDPDVILGYMVHDTKCIHWVFVKESWRSMGIARTLLKRHKFETCSHLTSAGRAIRAKYSITFNPFI